LWVFSWRVILTKLFTLDKLLHYIIFSGVGQIASSPCKRSSQPHPPSPTHIACAKGDIETAMQSVLHSFFQETAQNQILPQKYYTAARASCGLHRVSALAHSEPTKPEPIMEGDFIKRTGMTTFQRMKIKHRKMKYKGQF